MDSRYLYIYLFILIFSLLLSPASAEESLQARAEVNWRYGQERGILMGEFWIPFMQDDTSVLYGDLRMVGDNQDNHEGNIGVGYRKITKFSGLKGVAGAHGWIDRRLTARGSAFHQVTIGTEWLSDGVDVLLNGYLPLSSARTLSAPHVNPQAPTLSGTGIVVDTNSRIIEEPQHGFDVELGLELGKYFKPVRKYTDSLRVYGGGYSFYGDHTEDVAGWRTRIAADISSDIQLGARFQRDNVRGSQGFLEATIRFPFGQKISYRREGLRARLDDSPERDIDVITSENVIDSGDRVEVLNKITGVAQKVLHVDNAAAGGGNGSAEAPFNTLADANAAAGAYDIIYVHRGDGTTTNQDQGITLNDTGQQLLGSGVNFVYDSGHFTTFNRQTPTSILLIPATAAPVMTTNGGNAISVRANDITVAGLTVDGTVGNISQEGINIFNADNITVHDMTVLSAGDGTLYDDGIQAVYQISGHYDLELYNNTVTGSTGRGFIVQTQNDTVANVKMYNNVSMDNGNRGIDLISRDTSTLSVDIYDNNFSNNTSHGLVVSNRDNTTLSANIYRNKMENNTGKGVYIVTAAAGTVISDLGGGVLGSVGQNSIFGNGVKDLDVDLNGGELKAENNWWGNVNGLQPGNVTLSGGSTVDYSPFLTSAP